jgi:hypothetical protein
MQVSKKIQSCRICQSSKLVECLDLGDQPPANSLRESRDDVLPLVPLKLLFCQDCFTVQLSETVNPEYLFEHYVWVTGTSSTAVEYSSLFCDRVLSHLPKDREDSPFIVEVASNDGTFLQRFIEAGCRVQGVDPARNIVEIAEKLGVPTLATFFNRAVAENISAAQGEAAVVIARNVIPHVKEIHSIIDGISHLVGEAGIGVIEFHYARKILDELHYDSIYHEHLFYFSMKTLGGLLERYGMKIFDVDVSPISGGSLVVYFSRHEKEKTDALLEIEEYEKRVGMNELQTWEAFAEQCKEHAESLKKIIAEAKENGSVIGYGASARSSTLLNFCGLDSNDIDYVIDKNELKQGLVTPGSDIDIVPLNAEAGALNDVAAIVMLAWNFEKEIEKELRAIGYKGPIIMPLPGAPRII